jgi:hypothetical protein
MMAAKGYHKKIAHDHEWITQTNFIAPNRFSKSFSSYSNKYTLDPNDTDTSATQKNAWTNKCTPHFVFNETEFPSWEGNTPTGKKWCSNHTNNNTENTQDYATVASDEQTEMATKILSLETNFTKHLELIVKQSKVSNKASQ